MDYGHKLTDEELKELEKRINAEYTQAEKEVAQKLSNYLAGFMRRDIEQKTLVDAGEISEREYLNWRAGQIATGKRWEELRQSLAEDMHRTNVEAQKQAQSESMDIYALNHNYGTYEVENGAEIDTKYTLYDRQTVERLVKDNPQMLPPPGKKVSERIKAGLDVRWNNQHIQSVMMQSLLQGESIGKIATRLANAVGDSNRAAAIRNARTMTTGAENAGRVDAYERAKEMGVPVRQMWVATIDDRTRESHRKMDGETIEPGETFSNKCRFPGDPLGEPSEVYNCRCTLVARIPGVQYTFAERGTDKASYEEWKKGKETEEKPQVEEQKTEEPKVEGPKKEDETRQVVQGKDLAGTWERRPDEFEFQIEDIINAQGFDGLPRVVSADEFDKYVQESNFVAQRTYSAVDNETLQAYQDSLYNGKWYVDCSVGGCAHGKGMYCAASYDGELNEDISQEMRDYISQNHSYTSMDAPHIIETFTVDKSANFLEIPKGVDDEEYVYSLLNHSIYLKKCKEEGLEEEGQKIIELKEKSSENYNNYLFGKITSEKMWEEDARIKEQREKLEEKEPRLKEINLETVKITERVNDMGEQVALLGYDGLHTHYGTCGNDTIIVNRTKLIFKGE